MPIRSIEMPKSALATVEPFQGLVFGDHGHAKDDAVCWDKYPVTNFSIVNLMIARQETP